MAWIKSVPEELWDDQNELCSLHPKVVDPTNGRVDNVIAVHSLNPKGMAAHQSLYTSAMAGTPSLPKVDRELIALVVSLENNCHY